MQRIAFIDTVHPVLENGLKKIGFICDNLTELSKAEILQKIAIYHGIVVRSRIPIDYEILSRAKSLAFIARSGAGLENIDVEYCKDREIVLFNAPEGNRNAVGEQALGMILSLFNRLSIADREVRNGEWNREKNRGVELDGKTVGIIGFGNNGSAFASKLRGFDVKVLAFDKYKTGYTNSQVKEVGMDEIFQEADILSLHIPQNSETIGLFNSEFIEKFRKEIYVVNIARGRIVETSALVKGLKSGKIKGACLDVLEYEKSSFEHLFNDSSDMPEPFRFLIESDKVLLSPHIGGWTHESYYKLSAVLLNKIKNHYGL
ncbi:MAG: NAD(P)-dependent oxidoreductase [Putridiphycobacter sp.]|nr:NAD(P)-dependent oxidoreductase [Putridiphycobacter sp.]